MSETESINRRLDELERLIKERDLVLTALQNSIGAEFVSTNPADLTAYGTTHIPIIMKPNYVVRVQPRRVDQVVAAVQIANQYKVPIVPVASSTIDASDSPGFGGILLDTYTMNAIWEIDEDAMYAVVEPGVSHGQLNKELHKHGFWFPFSSQPPGISVMGATEESHHYMRTSVFTDVLGFEVVLPDGTLVRTGSSAHNAGWYYPSGGPYPWLWGLFMNANGTLGVVTKVALRIYPFNNVRTYVVAEFDEYRKSVDYVRRIARAHIPEHAVIYHYGFYSTWEYCHLVARDPSIQPPDLRDIVPWEKPKDGRAYNLVVSTMSGYEESIDANRKVCTIVAKDVGGRVIPEDEFREEYPGMYIHFEGVGVEHMPNFDIVRSLNEPGLGFMTYVIVEGQPRRMVELERDGLRKLYDRGWGCGYETQFWDQARRCSLEFTPWVSPNEPARIAEYVGIITEFYQWALQNYGSLPFKGPPPAMSIFRNSGGNYLLWKKIKQAIDPNNIMNPSSSW